MPLFLYHTGGKTWQALQLSYSGTVLFLDDVRIPNTSSNIFVSPSSFRTSIISSFFLLSNFILLLASHLTSVPQRVWDEWREERIVPFPGFALKKPCTKIQPCIILMWVSLLVWECSLPEDSWLLEPFTASDGTANWCDYANKWVAPGWRWISNLPLALCWLFPQA